MSQIRASQVFAAQRQVILEDILSRMRGELIPEFNAEIEDIQRQHAEIAKSNVARADNMKKARILKLVHTKQQILAELSAEFIKRVESEAAVLNGVVFQCTEVPRGKTKEETYPKVKFDDGSVAKWPTKLHVPNREFAQA